MVKLEDGSSCPACAILQYYCNKDSFEMDVECVFCHRIIQNENKQEAKGETKEIKQEDKPEE